MGYHPPPPIVRAAHVFCHLLSRRRLQTHPRFRFLVRPQAAGRPSRPPGAGLENSETALQDLLASFPAIVGDRKGKPSPKHKICHTIETTGRPVFAKARRLDTDKLRKAEAEFRELEAAGIIRRSDLPWSSPLHTVRKKDGSWRPCGDYRRLNLAKTHDPLTSILDLSNKLHGCKFFSCIDLVKGYHQIPMAAQDIPKTAIITPFGLFEYLFMPFGLRNVAQTFQRFMDSILKHLPFVFCYLNDIIIASTSLEEHIEHLRQIFTILSENGLQINPAKCVFAAAAVEFLGHRVDQNGVRPLQRHVQAISDFPPPPQDVKQLQQFLGMVNFYRRFLPGIARTLQPLTDALKGAPKTQEWPPPPSERPRQPWRPRYRWAGGRAGWAGGRAGWAGAGQPAQHPALTHDSISPSVKRVGRAVPQASEGRPAVPGRRCRLARPPPMGAAGYQNRLPGGQQIFAGGGGVRLTTGSTGTVHQHRRVAVAVAVLPQRAADNDDRPPATAGVAQRGPGPISSTGGVATGPLRPRPQERCAAAAVADLRRPLQSAGAVNSLLPARDGG